MRKRKFLTLKQARELVENLNIGYHRGGHIGLNVKIYNFPEPIQSILFDALGLEMAFETFEPTIIGTIWMITEDLIKREISPSLNLYTEGRSGGYWGFYEADLEKEGIGEFKAIKKLRKCLAKAIHSVFGYNSISIFNLGQDLNPTGSEYIHFEIICHLKKDGHKGYTKEVITEGVPQWCKLKEKLQKMVDGEEYTKLAQTFRNFKIAWNMKDIVCFYAVA